MAKNNLYKQCTLRLKDATMVAWLPIKFAKENLYLRLKEHGKWENGWQVVEVFDDMLTEDVVITNKNSYKEERERTDI